MKRADLVLAASPESAGRARRFVRDRLEIWAVGVSVDEVILMVSELVTNVGLHAGTEARVEMAVSDDRLRVEVTDRSDGEPRIQPQRVGAETGRGLMIVDALADSWGIRPVSPGKTVWFEVAVETAV